MVKEPAEADAVRLLSQESGGVLRLLFEKSLDPILLLSGGRIVDCNRAALEFMDASVKEQLIGHNLALLSPDHQPDGRPSSAKEEEILRNARVEKVARFEWLLRSLKDRQLWIIVSLIVIPISDTDITYMRWADISAQKRTEEALITSRLQLAEAMDLAQIVYWQFDPATEEFIFNDDFYAFYGTSAEREGGYRMRWEEYVARFVPVEDRSLVDEAARKGQEDLTPEYKSQTEHRIVRRDGEVRTVIARTRSSRDATGHVISCFGANQDITERKRLMERHSRLEQQLRQSQKMEAIGTLTGGIAHDFNNILAAVLGNTELALDDVPPDNPGYRFLLEARKAAGRGRDLVKHLLAFSRQTVEEPESVPVGALVEETVGLIRALLPAGIDIRKNIADQDAAVLGDPVKIQRIILNLCANGIHAMRGKGGVLDIGLSLVDLVCEEPPVSPLPVGRYLKLSVADSGGGIAPEVAPHIFEPFFTTKTAEEGSGLGLPVVRDIVEGLKGAVVLQNKPGKGATFLVYLPALEAAAAREATMEEKALTGHERILFVDDEPAITEMSKNTMERLGYAVDAMTDSVEAYEAFREHPALYDLVITDQSMPRLTGIDLARKLLTIRPDIPIILSTGFTEAVSDEEAKETGIREYVMKPLEKRGLAETIRRALEKK